ncbi:SRPBCC domain-containing protein [Aestuariibius insulae]|uniref:SRPBCC domain-containing protein n=1 Tax=Aestuariibius insulae TaxID=2058287 RepID=UPI00345EABEA
MADFATLTLDRDIACTPARLFRVMTDRELRQTWSEPNDESVLIIDEYDCRPGGREEIRCGPKEAPEFRTTGLFHVVTPEFLSLTDMLIVNEELVSVSLCGHEIAEGPKGSTLCVTLQITSLAGADLFDEYRGGWSAAVDSLSKLASEPEPS